MNTKSRILEKRNITTMLLGLFIIVIAFVTNVESVYAAGAVVSVSSSDVTQGDQFDVIVNIKADSNIGAYNFYIDYDPEIIEAVSGFDGGGNGRIQIIYYVSNASQAQKDMTVKIKFKAKAPGTTSVKYVSISEDDGIIDFDSTENMSVTATDGSVKVKAPYVASTDNYLKNLKVEAVKSDGSTYTLDLSPKFSKDVTKYNANAVEGVTKLVITADKSDTKATVKISGRDMDPGKNTTTITVTAEDGSTRKYIIDTNVEKKPETTTPPPEPIIVQIDGTDMHIKDIDNDISLPEGFEKLDYEYKGKKVVAAKGLVKNLLVMNVAKSDGSENQLYIYDELSDSFYPMSNIQLTQKLYTIVKEPQDLIIPSGYVETTVTIDGQTFKGWSNSEVENIYLIYAMNWNGENGLYYYDENEKQVIRYFDATLQAGADTNTSIGIDDYNKLVSQNDRLKAEINELKAENNSAEAESVKLYKYLALGSCIMAVIYLGIIIFLVVSKKSKQAKEIDINNGETEVSEEVAVETESTEEAAVETESTEEAAVETESTEEVAIETETTEEVAVETETTEEVVVETETIEEIVDESDTTKAQVETDDIIMDFEDIITAETEASIVKETEQNDYKTEASDELLPHVDSEEIKNSNIVDIDKKKKVAEIMEDDDSSIDSDDLDMVIDELFEDLFD